MGKLHQLLRQSDKCLQLRRHLSKWLSKGSTRSINLVSFKRKALQWNWQFKLRFENIRNVINKNWEEGFSVSRKGWDLGQHLVHIATIACCSEIYIKCTSLNELLIGLTFNSYEYTDVIRFCSLLGGKLSFLVPSALFSATLAKCMQILKIHLTDCRESAQFARLGPLSFSFRDDLD